MHALIIVNIIFDRQLKSKRCIEHEIDFFMLMCLESHHFTMDFNPKQT